MLIMDSKDAAGILDSLNEAGETAWEIGTIKTRSENEDFVRVEGFTRSLEEVKEGTAGNFNSVVNGAKGRLPVGVLISGSGTNLQALIDQSLKAESKAEIRLVISNVPGVKGLERASRAGIKSKVVINI